MYEIHNLTSAAMIAEIAHQRAGRPGASTRIRPRVRRWRHKDVQAGTTHVTH